MSNYILNMDDINDPQKRNEVLNHVVDLDHVVGRFEINDDKSVTMLDSDMFFETEEEFLIEQALPTLNRLSIVTTSDGFLSVVNGKPLTFMSNEQWSESVKEGFPASAKEMKEEVKQYTGSDSGHIAYFVAPIGFKAQSYFDNNNLEELQAMLTFDGRALPNYMNIVDKIVHANACLLPESGEVVFNHDYVGFDDLYEFIDHWDLDKTVLNIESKPGDEEGYSIEFTARDFINGNVDVEFFNMDKIKTSFLDLATYKDQEDSEMIGIESVSNDSEPGM